MTVAAGSFIDHYRIERPCGSGAFATVYLAHDDRFDDTVAIKVLAENRALDLEARRRFIEEAQKLRTVHSPEIVTVFDVGETATNQPYMVLEYADRGDLAARRTAHRGHIATGELLRVADHITGALGSLHGRGLVHRDVKPHNILIASGAEPADRHAADRPANDRAAAGLGGEPYGAEQPLLRSDERLLLGDLGFVKDLEAASGFTVGGGTMAFSAPEQAQPIGRIDHRADVFAASAVVAWLLAGGVPHQGETWRDLLGRLPPEPALDELRVALWHGLAPDPVARPSTIAAWRASLTPSPAGAPVAPSEPASASEPAPAGDRRALTGPTGPPGGQSKIGAAASGGRRRMVAVLLAAGVVAAAVAAGALIPWSSLRSRGDDPVIADGVAVTERTVGDSRITITGPAEATIDQEAVFRAEVEGGAVIRWIEPDGTTTDAALERTYVARSEGRFLVSLLVAVPGEEPVIVTHAARAGP